MRPAKLTLGLLTLAAVFGCSPVSRLRVSFVLPNSAGAIDFAKLHVRGRVACESFDLSAPKPKDPQPPPAGLEEREEEESIVSMDAGDAAAGDADPPPRPGREAIRPARFDREGDFFQLHQRASSCRAAATGWYDTNGSGKPDAGDFVATMPTTEFHDRGLCMGNLTTVGPLEMKPWTP